MAIIIIIIIIIMQRNVYIWHEPKYRLHIIFVRIYQILTDYVHLYYHHQTTI